MSLQAAKRELRKCADKKKAVLLRGFFKTGPGEYGQGDVFLGVTVPCARKVAKEFQGLSLAGVAGLLKSPVHEERLLALLILIRQFLKAGEDKQRRIYEFYLRHTRFINNWDLVDLSSGHIVGMYLLDKEKQPLYRLAKSASLWERRIAMVATMAFIKHKKLDDTFAIAEMLLSDSHDLIHKATGWMLREAGKRDARRLESFLRRHLRVMPRTMLRYAIEKFPEPKRRL